MTTPEYDILNGPSTETFSVAGPLYCPFDSVQNRSHCSGKNSYHPGSISFNPFTMHAQASSGSPVVLDQQGRFFGFLKYAGIENSTYAYDAGKGSLTVTIPEGQTLYVATASDRHSGDYPHTEAFSDAHWKVYNAMVMEAIGYERLTEIPAFWSQVEYCTWVEQKYLGHAHNVLNHDMVMKFVDTIDSYGYPKGKVTIDHGWSIDPERTGFGDWEVDAEKFPSLQRTAEAIAERGHIPGLWFGLPKIHPQSKRAKAYPELVGQRQTFPWQELEDGTDGAGDADRKCFLNHEADIKSFTTDVLTPYYEMGFRKFKIDMSYHYKHHMILVNKGIYEGAKAISDEIEMEFHLPDIFGAKYTDVVRTNDVWCMPYRPWFESAVERYRKCYRSAPGRVLNRCLMGGNDPRVREIDYLRHVSLYREGVGYPVLSMLPHHLSDRCVEAAGSILHDHDRTRNVISDF